MVQPLPAFVPGAPGGPELLIILFMLLMLGGIVAVAVVVLLVGQRVRGRGRDQDGTHEQTKARIDELEAEVAALKAEREQGDGAVAATESEPTAQPKDK